MSAPRKYGHELRERATRTAVDARQNPATKAGAIKGVAVQLGMPDRAEVKDLAVQIEAAQAPEIEELATWLDA